MADVVFNAGLSALLAVSIGVLLIVHSKQPQPYLDEIFHIPQAQKYCEHKFTDWDPKITTLPGVYLVSFVLLQAVALISRVQLTIVCSVFWLRFTNVLFAVGNAWLLREVLVKVNSKKDLSSKPKTTKQAKEDIPFIDKCSTTALILSLFPVLYFFTFLYYTDAGSTFFVLLMYLMSLRDQHVLASISGFMAIMFRQTNIVWVVFTAGTTAINQLQYSVEKHLYAKNNSSLLHEFLQYILSFFKNISKMINVLWAYGFLVAGFFVFIFVNGGVVVGDRSSHEACLNFPQLFYFSGFVLAFSSPLLLLPYDIIQFLKALKNAIVKPLRMLVVILVFLLMVVLVYKFTHVHKYLLADNRHYPFYIWHKFFARHWLARYFAIPLYMYAAYGMTALLSRKQSPTWQIVFWICVMVVTVPQKLFEFRYFIVPYIMFRVHSPLLSYYRLILEFCIYFVVNLVTVYLFLEKPFVWSHEPDQIQRFMW